MQKTEKIINKNLLYFNVIMWRVLKAKEPASKPWKGGDHLFRKKCRYKCFKYTKVFFFHMQYYIAYF